MIGQGRPSSLAFACAWLSRCAVSNTLGRATVVLAIALWTTWVATTAGQENLINEPVQLRISWGGGEATRWVGRFGIEQGAISTFKPLGLAADAAASAWLENGDLRIAALSAREQDAVQVDVETGQNSTLLIELSKDAVQPTKARVALTDVRKQPYVLRLDDRGNVLRIEFIPNEALQIKTDREQMIFSPGDRLAFELIAALADVSPGTTLDIRTTLSPARRADTLWSNDQRLEVPVRGQPQIQLSVPLPDEEGVYTVRVMAMRPSGFRERFFPGTPTPLAERVFDVVVLDARPPSTTKSDQWETVLEIDPTSPRWWERLPSWTQLRRIPGLNRGPLGSLRAGSIESSAGSFVELPPTVRGMDPHWQAYSLPLEAVGEPHLLEIEYPADREQHLGLSIVEPSAAGAITGIGRDSGVYVEGFGRSESSGRMVHRLVFWPRTQAPLLLVTNAHPSAAAHFGHLRVRKRTSGRLASPAASLTSDRLVAAYLARPLLAETFGASERHRSPIEAGPFLPQSVDDWQTFYEGATRLADYVRYAGYNSAVVGVLADGSSLYPSPKLLPTPLYSSERTIANTAEQDALELMLRVFDREGLSLLPAIQFAAPLPELESLRRGNNPQTSGLEWVGPDGRTWLATHGTKNGLAPYYNLLDPRVQRAMLDVVNELVDRYHEHPSFAGLAVQLSARGYAQLPPLDWGLDDATIGRFQRDTGIQLAATGPQRFAARHQQVTGEHAAAWRTWRAARLTEFYQQLAAALRPEGNERRLLITLESSFDHPQLAARIRPDLINGNRVESTLLDIGVDCRALEELPGVVVCPTRYVETMVPLTDGAVHLEINQATAAWHPKAKPNGIPAALLYHPSQRRRLPSFQAKSPIRVEGPMTLVRQPLAHGPAVRAAYVHAILDNDPAILLDGGELLPIGQEDVLRQVRSLLQQLPVTAEVAEHVGQPVFVRAYTEPNRTTLLAVNASPWHATAEVMLDVSQPAMRVPLASGASDSGPNAQATTLPAGKQPWSLSLEPYGVEAVRIETSDVKVVEVRTEASDMANSELTTRLAELANRDFTAPRVYSALANPSFETLGGAAPVTGWKVFGEGADIELDAVAPQDGNACIYVRSRDKIAVVESDPFPTPDTGQLLMTVFARCRDVKASTEVWLVFEAEAGGQDYRRAFIVGGTHPGTQSLQDEWRRPYAIYVNDLPLDTQSKMRVRFELLGPGEVWLDNVVLYDLLFPLKFYPNAQVEIKQFLILIHAAQRAFEAGRVADCVKLLETYWPRFMTNYTPLTQPRVVADDVPEKAQPSSPPTDEQQQHSVPSLSERIKRFVPFVR